MVQAAALGSSLFEENHDRNCRSLHMWKLIAQAPEWRNWSVVEAARRSKKKSLKINFQPRPSATRKNHFEAPFFSLDSVDSRRCLQRTTSWIQFFLLLMIFFFVRQPTLLVVSIKTEIANLSHHLSSFNAQ
jgi:hypothetical protein